MPTDTLPRPSHVAPSPSKPGRFGDFGGAFVPEILHPVLEDLKDAWAEAWPDPEYQAEYRRLLKDYVGRPTPLTRLDRLTERLGGATVWAKREDLCHTGAHKINNAIGQVLLARRMGKERIIAETGAGQHGVATATACALFGVECVVYMGAEDIERQHLNVQRMRLLGATVRSATSGSQTLKDATNEAFRDWVSNPESTYYIIGSAIGPHPYPAMVRELHRVIGDETRRQLFEATGRETPDAVVACVGGGSNAIGIWAPFIDEPDVRLVGVEAAGEGLGGRHAATLTRGDAGRLPRDADDALAGRRRPGRDRALGLGRTRLPGRRPAARAPSGDGPCRGDDGDRPRGHARRVTPERDRGHYPGAGDRPRRRRAARASGRARRGRDDCVQLLRPRRQGHGDDLGVAGRVNIRCVNRDA